MFHPIYTNMTRQIHVNNRDDAKLKGLATELSLSVGFESGQLYSRNKLNKFPISTGIVARSGEGTKKLRFFYTSEKNLTNFAPKLNVLQIFLNQKRKTGTGSKKLAFFASKTQFFP